MTTTARSVCDPNCHARSKCGLEATLDQGRIIAVEPARYPAPGFENRICLMGRSRPRVPVPPGAPAQTAEARRRTRRGTLAGDLLGRGRRAVRGQPAPHRREVGTEVDPVPPDLRRLRPAHARRPLALRGTTGASAVRASGIDYGVGKGLEAMFAVPAATFFKSGGHALSDASNSKLTIVWGGNPAVTRSVDHVALKEAQRGGTELVCIDPVLSETGALLRSMDLTETGERRRPRTRHGARHRVRSAFRCRLPRAAHEYAVLIERESGRVLRDGDLPDGEGDAPLVWCAEANAPRRSRKRFARNSTQRTRLRSRTAEPSRSRAHSTCSRL